MFQSCTTSAASLTRPPSNPGPYLTFAHCRIQFLCELWMPLASQRLGSPNCRTVPSSVSCAGVEFLGPGPSVGHGIVCQHRSAIFRVVESIALPSSGGSYTRLDQHLSADEVVRISAMLGTKGLSTNDVQIKDGRWGVAAKDDGTTAFI
jgi:hypothetical protein